MGGDFLVLAEGSHGRSMRSSKESVGSTRAHGKPKTKARELCNCSGCGAIFSGGLVTPSSRSFNRALDQYGHVVSATHDRLAAEKISSFANTF
jgi:hypothetical protein